MKRAWIVAVFTVMLIVAVITVNANSQHWKAWRGDSGRTSSIAVPGNARPLMNEDWGFKLKGNILCHPIAMNNKVFVGDSDYFYALDISTGVVIWRFPGDYDSVHTPTITGENILLSHRNADGYGIVALNYGTGDMVCRMTTEFSPSFTLASDECIYYSVNNGDETVYTCKHLNKDAPVWEYHLSGVKITDCMDGDIIYLRSIEHDKDVPFPEGVIHALDSMSGSQLWELKPELWDCAFDTNMIAKDGVMYVGSQREGGAYVLAISGKTGELLWKHESESSRIACKALSGDRLLVADDLKGLYCISAETGILLWSSAKPEMEDCLVATTDELAYVCYPDPELERNSDSEKKSMVLSIDLNTGDILDKEKHEHTPFSICADDKHVYFTTEEGELHSYTTNIGLVGIIVQPSESFLVPGQSQSFTFINYDMRKEELDDIHVRWMVSPPGLGQITKDGVFTAGNGDVGYGSVQAHHGVIAGVAMINICDEPELELDEVDFGMVAQGDTKTRTINTNMNRYCRCNIETSYHPDWIKDCSFSLNPLTEIVALSILADASDLDPGEYADYVSFEWVGGELMLNVSMKVMSTEKTAFKVSPDRIDLGKMTSWDTSKLDKTLHLENIIGEPLGCEMITTDSWLDVNPRGTTVKIEGCDFIVSCRGDRITPGQSLTGIIKIKPQFGIAQELTVTVEKLKNTTLKLRIDDSNAFIDGSIFGLDVPPQIISGRTMVPIRIISEAFGAKVDWDGDERRIDISLVGVDGTEKNVRMWIGRDTAEVEGIPVILDSPPTIVSGRTLVPVRFISEAFGASVEWNQQDREVTIIYTP